VDTNTIEHTLLSHPLPELLPADQGWVMPHYSGLSIANLPSTIAALLGGDLPGALPPLPRELWADWLPNLRCVVLVVLDALGYRMLQGMWTSGEGEALSSLASAGRVVPLTSVFPSTTDAALVSLRTGCPPAQHGWLAYLMYLRELGIASNGILLCPMWTRQSDLLLDWGLEPDGLIPVPTLAQRLESMDVNTGAVLSVHFAKSGFTRLLYRGVSTLRTHHHASDLWGQTRRLLAEKRGERALLTIYWSGLDTLAHAYGPHDYLWAAEFRSVCRLLQEEFLARLPAEDREGTLLLITADHGQIHVPPANVLSAMKDRELSKHLFVPIVGESRAAFVYPRYGRAQAIRDHLQAEYPGRFTVLDSAQALDAGLMGLPVYDETYARAGRLLVLPNGNHALQHYQPAVSLIGRHGGLSQDEMLVPLIGARLEALET
jgi:hypothetical protein